MRIEKINDTQIKCVLNRQDLSEREMKISELAYCSEKAKSLFSELMMLASSECGFEAENTPLMIEAIPLTQESLLLLVTKITDADELDSRFSYFSSAPDNKANDEKGPFDNMEEDAEGSFTAPLHTSINKTDKVVEKPISEHRQSLRCFTFSDLSSVIRFSSVVPKKARPSSALYKDESNDRYLLTMMSEKGKSDPDYVKVCNIAQEFGKQFNTRYASIQYFNEHYTRIIKQKAINVLSNLTDQDKR